MARSSNNTDIQGAGATDTLNDNERIIRFELVKEYLEKAQVIVKKGRIQDRDEHVIQIKRSKDLNPKEKSFCLEYLRELIVEMNYSQRIQITQDPRSDKYFIKAYTYEMKIVKKINRCTRCYSNLSNDEHCLCVVLCLLNNSKPSGNEFIDKFMQNYYMSQEIRRSALEYVIEWIPYEFLTGVKYISKGGFGSLYSATLANGWITGWDEEAQQIIRTGPKIVALKLINELNEQDNKVLEEVISNVKFSSQGSHGVKCYGMTNFPEREKLAFLLDYMENGDLNTLLKHLEKLSCGEYVIPELGNMFSRSHFHVPNEISSIIHEFVNLPEPKNETN
ncbi:10208_t:CDS:2 [Dentiscutata erythropus]|uniref:10208_t:CDS:1 n=1 Tax=Dentiscutata erythropus TaxID=1348616 RepID=A0A9N8WJH1_9GLOM|nr:10208_t:CDS:2 [Dentiscutata erythropus]